MKRAPTVHAQCAYDFVFGDYIAARSARDNENYRDRELRNHKALREYVRSYAWTRFLLDLHDLVWKNPAAHETDILFVGSKLYDLVVEAGRKYSVTVLAKGSRSRREAKRHRQPYIPVDRLMVRLFRSALIADRETREIAVNRAVGEIGGLLEEIRPRVVVLFSNTNFFERAVVLAARRVGIPSVKLQHGMMHHDRYDTVVSNISDYTWVWGEYFKKFVSNSCSLSRDRIWVFGYPFLVEKECLRPKSSKESICFLGQNFGNDQEYLRRRDEALTGLGKIGAELGFDVVYRPHPTEFKPEFRGGLRSVERLPWNIIISDKNETFKTALSKYDVFFTFYSTALVEAALRRKVTCQVMGDWGWNADNFEELGASYRITGTLNEYRDFLSAYRRGELDARPVSEEYISTEGTLLGRLEAGLESLFGEKDAIVRT